MHASIFRFAFAATVATSAVAAPAAAQQPSRAPVVLAASRSMPSSGADVRAVAVYRLLTFHSAGLPSQIVISDSAGRLVASYRLRADARSYPMMLDVSTSGLVLQGETPQGILTLYLYDPSTPSEGRADGHWWLGDQQGDLRGKLLR